MENFNVTTSFTSLCKHIDVNKLSVEIRRNIQRLLSKQIKSSLDYQQTLDIVSSLLLEESYTLLVADYFSPLLLELLTHCKISENLHYRTCFSKYEIIGIILAKLVGKYSVVSEFCLHYFDGQPSLLERYEQNEEFACKKKKMDGEIYDDILQKLLEATFCLLIHNFNFFRKIWNLSILVDMIKDKNLDIKWLSCLCLATVTEMSNVHLNAFLKQNFNESEIIKYKLKYKNLIQNVWEVTHHKKEIVNVENEDSNSQCHLFASEFCTDVISVSGILLKKNNFKMHNSTNLVLVPSVKLTLRNLSLGIVAGECMLLQGAVGCGKTALIEYMAQITGRQLIKVQLGDQIDSKLLLGSHCCTDIPGEFIWKPGPLTQAMISGSWLLLEDIDYAPMDIMSLIIPVLQSKSLMLPGHADLVKAKSGFQLFATQRLIGNHEGRHSEFRSPSDMVSKLWRKIIVDSLSRSELEELIITKWPVLKPIVNQIMDIYFMISSGEHDHDISKTIIPKSSSGRLISTRDLLKWCQRIIEDFDLTSTKASLAVFQDAIDCFCKHISSTYERVNLAKSVGTKLNLTEAKIEYFCTKYKPEISISSDVVKIGRVTLMKRKQNTISEKRCSKTVYAHTRQSLALLESVAVAVKNSEPVLLVGETGTGKTSVVQYLADLLGHKLTVINMNQQSDSVDLLGGYKPVKLKSIIAPLHKEYEEIFCQSFSRIQNIKFLGHISKCYSSQRWQDMFKLMLHTQKNAIEKYMSGKSNEDKESLIERWKKLGYKIHQLQSQMKHMENTLAFSFIEGSLVKAIKEGEWILLDEINLAEAETLECLGGLLESASSSITLTERGDTEAIKRHPEFCLFACMNPATDIGRKDLPPGIRNRFSEFFMEDLEDKEDLAILIDSYLKGLTLSTETVNNIVKFYIQIRKDAECKYSDGTGHHPHYSLRTLCRALDYAGRNPCYCVPRSLFEGFCLSFLTQLDRSSHPLVIKQIKQHILKKNQQSILHQPIKQPGEKFICFEGYWIQRGENNPVTPSNYILTPSVKQNLKDLARIVSAGKHPVLLQGETSVGKTSLIQWLASVSGNKCVRINNHEHSDLQEYVGNYTSDDDGKLFFKEGILVEAMKFGYWIILDELNLAPTEVLEALNRVLDDNRELFIPETQQTIKAHPQFMLFATQNPPGLYGGRKILSRAFRNRFIELHFDEIPPEELQTILEKRCALPPTYSKKLVNVMQELQIRRCQSGIFAGKQGYITLRDLFRWGERYRLSTQTEKFYDWNEHLANEGYMLLAGRVRKQEEADVIQEVIEKCMHCKIKPKLLFTNGNGIDNEISKVLFDLKSDTLPEEFSHIVWTSNMKRLAILVSQAMKFGEPVLLVGETGCGKTTVCQLLASLTNKTLYSLNCHMHSESADFLGGLRPVRHLKTNEDSQKLFEWVDGPLTLSMKTGNIFLADEISLADDSVLERLNSVLEPECTLLLAEKGNSENNLQEIIVTAKDGFQFLATMNPGGDFGKKELSPALRNRFTEIWCPSTTEKEDIINIIKHNIKHPIITNERKDSFGKIMMEFLEWFRNNDFGYRYSLSIRDILSWVNFINYSTSKNSNIAEIHLSHAYIHGACLVILDSLGSGMTSDSNSHQIKCAYDISVKFLEKQMKKFLNETEFLSFDLKKSAEVTLDQEWFGIEPFYIPMGLKTDCSLEKKYILSSESTKLNAIRLLRAMYLPKPILLEGIPGVGKTSLVCALAKASGHQLIRINLSEQTDISDLFGSDLPVEGKCGIFAWRDGPLLQALKSGSWILLDELNLASQSVLEGLNACLDHRGEVYIPELGRSFKVQQGRSWIFGCQNPYKQGGARKGLPRSFLNRFTQVYIQPMNSSDLFFISRTMFPTIPHYSLLNMINFNEKIVEEIQIQKLWGEKGPSWEFNLRDILRWCEVLLFNQDKNDINPGEYVDLIYGDRMRTLSDKKKVLELYEKIFGKLVISQPLQLRVTDKIIQVGYSFLPRLGHFPSSNPLFPLHNQLKPLQSLMKCIEMKWLAILVGSSSVGKTSIVNLLATLTGQSLFIFTVNSEMDTTDLLGGFEQRDLTRHLDKISKDLEKICKNILWSTLSSENYSKNEIKYLFESWNAYHHLCFKLPPSRTNEEIKVFQNKIDALWKIINCLNKLLIPNIISPTIYEELNFIKNSLTTVEESLKSSGVVSSGGRFEWIDSILVTAIKKGYWLLIDDVNFCSPSVLDRLNGLLEPNGVLTLSELGVIGEEVPVITPHPNFRLIFAMNPKNGEISPAMRNRGIEIYIPGEADGHNFDDFDLYTLLQCKGLNDSLIISDLLCTHKMILEEYSGNQIEVPTVLELLQTTSLCVQLLQCGYHPENAFIESCNTVYVKGILNHFVKQKIEMCFKELISGFSTLHNYSDTNILSSLMPSALEFYMDPILARLKQESILCNCLLYNVENNNKMKRIVDESMEDFTVDKTPLIAELPFSIESTEDQIYLICCVAKMFIETSTICDFSYREFWIQQKVSHLENKCEMFQNVSSHLTVISKYLCTVFESPIMQQLYNYLQNFSNSDKLNDQLIDDMLLDIRWNTALQKKIFILSKENQDLLSSLHSFGNRFQLFLHYQLFRFIQDTCIHTTKQNRNFSLANLSKAFIEGRIIRNDLSHSVIQFVLPLLCEIDKEILLLLNQRNYLCKTTDLWKIIEAIRYYHYFVAICYEICTKQSIKHQLSLLILHWRWIEKRFLPYLFNENSRNESENCNLKIIVNDIKKALEPNISRMHELKLKSSKYLSFCVPIQDEIAASVFIDIQRLSKTLNIYNYIKNSNQQLISVYLYGSKWMEQLQNCLAVLTNSDLPEHINKAKDMLKVIEIDMSNKKLLNNQNMKLSEICSQNVKVSCEELTFHVQLSPMMDYIYVIGKQKLLYHTLCDIHITVLPEKLLSLINNKFNKNVSRCSEELLCKINKENILYPIEYVNEYGIFQKNNAVISLLLNFFTHLKWSPTSAFISEFLTWNICDTDLLETLITNRTENISVWKKEGTFMQPVRFFIFLMLQNDFDSVSFTVRNYFAKSEQLKKLNSLLWKNALDFCHNAPSFKLVNALVVIVWFNYIAWCLLSEIKKDVQHVSSLDELHSLLLMIDFPSDFYNIVEKTVYSIKELYQSIMEGVSEFSLQWILGKASAYVGLLTFQLFIPRDIVDPIQKWKIKLHYFTKEHNEIYMELKLRNIYSEILTGMKLNPTNECHPVISYLLERKDFLKEKKKELKKKIFFRPNTPQYEDLLQDVHHFLSSVGSANTMLSMLEQLDHVKEMCTVGKDKDVMKLEKVLREIERWQKSEDSFSNKLQEKYLLYGDLIIPFLAGLKQMAFGVQTAANYVSSQLFKLQFSQDLISIEKFFIKLLEFPYVSISYNEDLSPAYFLSQSSTISFFESLLNYVFKENSFIVQENITKLIMSGLIELKNEILLTKGDDLYALRVFKLLSKFLNVIFNVWHQQETEQKRKEEEEQALYEYRISQKLGSLSEEQQQKLEIKELFPSYEEEFNVKEDDDLKNSSDPSDPEQNIYSHPNNITFSLKHQDMIDIWSIHATIVSILSNKSEFPYISQFHSNGKYDLKRLEYIQPFMLRYEVVQYLVKDIGQNLDSMLDGYTINSNLLTNFATQNVFKQLDNTCQKDFDVYHNCNPSESIQCQIILKKLTEKLHSLLEQFPDHPTLKQVLKIIDRILSFPVTSPLMKFVTGFELILTVSQDWEINAHKGVSLINELSEITEKIISWRKLELRCWSGCLDSLYNKAYSNCAKWWFYLYSVISPIIGDGNLNEEKWPDETRDNFIGTLQQFVEHSTVGEFQARIDLLYTFMEHIKHYLPSHSQADLCNILSNIYYYYHQFVISVHEKISTDRKVIEKEIKEFIKIIRWSDINFWAVKQQVEKSHQTLHKHMKQYEKVLNQSAQPYFELCKNVELEEEIKMERSELNCSDFISALTLQQYLGNSSSQIEFCQDYYKKMRNLCKKIYKASKIFENINFLEDFAGEIITSAHDLQLLNVSKDADEERRKKEIRSIRLQKQKGLSDLFKALTSVGLSFKLGTVYWKDINIKNLLSLSFFDIETALNSMVYERKGDKIWKHNSKRIHKYFYRSIFKFFSLATALESPNKDLSPDNIERCKGFIGHLLYLICNQQQQIKENVESILNIRNLLNNLKSQAENFQDVHEMLLPSQDILEKWMINMKNLAYRTTTSLQQFIIILECCPDKVENSYILSNSDSLPSLILANKNDDMWIQIYDKANESLKTIQNLINQFPNKSLNSLYTFKDYEFISNAFKVFIELSLNFKLLKNYIEADDKINNFSSSLNFILDEIRRLELDYEKCIFQFRQKCSNLCNGNVSAIDELNSSVKQINHHVLLAVQNIFQYHSKTDEDSKKDENASTSEKVLTNGVIKEIKDIMNILNFLKIKKLSRKIGKHLKLIDSSKVNIEEANKVIFAILPFLDQYVNLAQFFIVEQTASHSVLCKLLYVLLGIFNDLAKQGFCLPPELLEENVQKKGDKFKEIEDGGFGEGEGMKDVSENLESEDQLEDAHKPGEKKQDELDQPECEEEEHGIEMSEDFEGKLHDPSKTDNSSDNNEDDNDDEDNLEKKMGDINEEENIEKLDNEIWGSDNENEDDELKDDNSGKGKALPEENIAAKDDNIEERNDDESKENQPHSEVTDHHDDEYDGEHANEVNEQTKQVPESFDIPDDLHIDDDIEIEEEEESAMEIDNIDNVEENSNEEEDDDNTNENEDKVDGSETENMESETVEDNKENIEYDQECPDKENEETEKSLPSKTDPTTETALPSENNNSTLCDNVTTVPESRGDYNEGNQNVSEQEQHGAGFADIDKYSKALGHETKNISSDSNMEKDIQSSSKRKKKPSQNPRTLGQLKENLLEVETIECSQSQEAKDSEECYKSDLYEHIQDPNSGYNIDVIDTASEQQINKENLINNDDINTSEEMETNLEENENETKIDAEENIYGKNISSTSEKQNIMSQKSDNDMEVDELPVEKSTDIIATSSVARGPNSSLHTQYDLWISLSEKRKLEELRLQLEHKIGSWIEIPDSEIQKNNLSKELWQQNIKVISPFVQELCEQLRLVLEPTKVSKLKGDYRTGKRLNMRKIIPYIASQFRKDKIWLRRTKPSKREYQIMLAVDDSSSMDDNKSRQLAMESVTLLGKSLSLLEVGQLSVVKFGEDVQLLHPFGEPFTDQAGIKVFQRFTFEQKKTRIAELLNYATTLMIDSRHGPVSRLMSKEIAQLLIILSDGRGIFSEGEGCVRQAVRFARNNNIFLVFIILDNPANKNSILDIKVPIFKAEKIEILSYMEMFPFPFYIILKEINSMPVVLGEALRQWFEMVTSTEH